MTPENSYLRHSAGSLLHRRLYSGRIILVTKSIIIAAIKIHTGRPFGMILGLVVVSGAVHDDKVALHFWSGKDCRSASWDKGRPRIASPLHRELSPSSFMLRNGRKKKKSYN